MPEPILEIDDLSIDYPINIGTVKAVRNVSITLEKGEALGLVGESGCGKSTLGLSILKLVRPPGLISGGRILYRGTDIVTLKKKNLLKLRGRNIAMIFQNPLTSLNPLFRIDEHFLETLRQHVPGIKKSVAIRRAEDILEALGLEKKRLYDYPHQLSGGMRQRIMIGLGLILNPDIIIADEPTTSLDVIVEAGFIDLLNRLRKEFDLSIILITHNLGMVAEIADRLAVMYGGIIVELGAAEQIYHRPRHPYTYGLINCVPNIKLDQEELVTMPGSPPDLVNPPPGCPFTVRCPYVMDRCSDLVPPLVEVEAGHTVACRLYDDSEVAPWMN
ncbi:MAG: ABC transporter ATP-binding protein [Spirochaetia bacterium]